MTDTLRALPRRWPPRPAAPGGTPPPAAPRGRGRLRSLRRALGRRPWGAARVCTAILVGVTLGCAPRPTGVLPYDLEPPSGAERYCAWFGDADDDVLYFGASAFWSTTRDAAGDPRADLRLPGPQLIGRFDLRRERFLPPLPLSPEASNGGIWDVRVVGRRLFFTDYFGTSGYVDLRSGAVVRLPALGAGLNEIAPGPGGGVLMTRYGEGTGGTGSVVRVGPEGELQAEHALLGVDGLHVAGKSLAYDPVRREIWVNTDLLPEGGDGSASGVTHDVRILDLSGREQLRFAAPEVQFMTFGPDGTGWFAEVDGSLLSLRVRPPERAGRALLTGLYVPLDAAFPASLDFVQDIQPLEDGGALVTRWSGVVHRVTASGRAAALTLPKQPGELYYTAVGRDGRLCATRCGDVSVVCADMPEPGRAEEPSGPPATDSPD